MSNNQMSPGLGGGMMGIGANILNQTSLTHKMKKYVTDYANGQTEIACYPEWTQKYIDPIGHLEKKEWNFQNHKDNVVVNVLNKGTKRKTAFEFDSRNLYIVQNNIKEPNTDNIEYARQITRERNQTPLRFNFDDI